ncbi:MAG TPA: hypothetical protein VFL60_06365 [Gaiellaceae bacterium]|nr:hypothetical protein [Gaiellaceae bacterium]
MDWAVYGALIAAALAVAGAAALLAVRGLQGWRTLRRARRHLARDLAALADSAGRTSAIVERISDQRELEASLARLRVALARLNVLRAALDEAAHPLRAATAFYRRA